MVWTQEHSHLISRENSCQERHRRQPSWLRDTHLILVPAELVLSWGWLTHENSTALWFICVKQCNAQPYEASELETASPLFFF